MTRLSAAVATGQTWRIVPLANGCLRNGRQRGSFAFDPALFARVRRLAEMRGESLNAMMEALVEWGLASAQDDGDD